MTGVSGANVEGNARITGALGAIIFVLLLVEGLTIPGVRGHITIHVVVGMVLVAFVAAKIATTTYRFARYYGGQRNYVEKGPPPRVLRVLGPLVTLSTIAVLATGVAAVLDTGDARVVVFAHKAAFVLWFCLMTVHVLGHVLETPALAFADWRRAAPPGARQRRRGSPCSPRRSCSRSCSASSRGAGRTRGTTSTCAERAAEWVGSTQVIGRPRLRQGPAVALGPPGACADDSRPTTVGTQGRTFDMSISAVGSAAAYAAPIRPPNTPTARAASASPAPVGRDSDGDNDASKGGSVDVRA